MRTFALAVVSASCMLAGCAAQVISSTPRSVIVRAGSVMAADAQNLAEMECAKGGLHARINSKPAPNQFAFDCVP